MAYSAAIYHGFLNSLLIEAFAFINASACTDNDCAGKHLVLIAIFNPELFIYQLTGFRFVDL
jgi:hypothetical protein